MLRLLRNEGYIDIKAKKLLNISKLKSILLIRNKNKISVFDKIMVNLKHIFISTKYTYYEKSMQLRHPTKLLETKWQCLTKEKIIERPWDRGWVS